METLSLPIAQQPRLVLVLPAVMVAASVLLGSIIAYVVRSAGGSNGVAALVAISCLALGITAGIASATGQQGTVRVLGEDTLEVAARWHSPRRIQLDAVRLRPFLWQSGRYPRQVGVYLELSDRHERITIGTGDNGLVAAFQAAGARRGRANPSVSLDPEDFRRLLERLPGQLATAREQ